jgi:excisionase family DNA binding protein
MVGENLYTIAAVAKRVGVHADTLRRWVKSGKVPEPNRDRNDWRLFTEEEVQEVIKFATAMKPSPRTLQSRLFKERSSAS